ncbi:MAG: hypothetical protein LBK25_09685 [Treponema sp.]|jgi:hypothetical protein|nr:hypothetical protein [Treponema sp.]
MNSIKTIKLISLIIILLSCSNRNNDKNINQEDTIENSGFHESFQQNISQVEMIYSMEYYKNEIIKYEDNYYGFKDLSMEVNQLMNISSIEKVDKLVPDLLTFLVSWFNMKGYIYYLYTFDDDQNIVEHYYCGQFVPFENHRILMEKLDGEILEYGDISVGDFNNDGVNEILLYSHYPHIGNVLCVYGFNVMENKLEELCLVPIYINFENPFPSVEYIGNGFKILEVLDDELTELAWNNYIWNNEQNKYIKQ